MSTSTFEYVGRRRLPAATSALPLGTTYTFDSRNELEEEIKNSLRGSDVNKSKLLKEIGGALGLYETGNSS